MLTRTIIISYYVNFVLLSTRTGCLKSRFPPLYGTSVRTGSGRTWLLLGVSLHRQPPDVRIRPQKHLLQRGQRREWRSGKSGEYMSQRKLSTAGETGEYHRWGFLFIVSTNIDNLFTCDNNDGL